MSDSRNAILSRIRRATMNAAPGAQGSADPAAAPARLRTPPPVPVPEIARPPQAERLERFTAKATELGCSIARIPGLQAAPDAAAAWLREQGAAPKLAVAPDPALSSLDWTAAGLAPVAGPARDALDGATSITRAWAGVAETGAIAVASDATFPVSHALLPDRHIILLEESQIVGGYEDVWARIRQTRDSQGVPRAVIFIGGPSRTADIEATLVMGAHGPRAVHVLIAGATGDAGGAGGNGTNAR